MSRLWDLIKKKTHKKTQTNNNQGKQLFIADHSIAA